MPAGRNPRPWWRAMLDSQEGAASPCAPAARYCLNTSSLLSGDRLPPVPQTPAPKRSAEPAQALQGFVMPWRTRKKPRRSQMRQFESPCCATVGSLTTNSAQIKPSVTRSKTAPQCLQKVVMLSVAGVGTPDARHRGANPRAGRKRALSRTPLKPAQPETLSQ